MLSFPSAISAERSASRPIRRLAAGAAVLALAVTVAAAGQEAWRLAARADIAAEARMVDLGDGRSIRLVCSGAGERTYVLEAGATGFAETWSWVHAGLDDSARVCAYDRAGLGLSDPAPGGFDPERASADLRSALSAAEVDGPYVLVGHSLGGFLVRAFAASHPEAVEALVLVDASHEDQLDRFEPDVVEQFRTFPDLLRTLAVLSGTGLLHLHSPLLAGADGLEGSAWEAARLFASDRAHLAASAAELDAWDELTARAREERLRSDLPVLVVSAGAPAPGGGDYSEAFAELHGAFAARFAAGRHAVLADADHFSILMKRPHAADLVRLIEGFADEAHRRQEAGPRDPERRS